MTDRPGGRVTGARKANIVWPVEPSGLGGALVPARRSAATAAGAARPPAPKKLLVLVSKPSTGPCSAAAKIESGSWSSESGSCATDSVRLSASYDGAARPRCVLIDCWYGFTSQY